MSPCKSVFTIYFQEFVTGLSVLSRGTLEEKLRWTFSLYDINGDGYITKEEMTEIVTAIYDLMGKIVEPMIDDEVVREKVEKLFEVRVGAKNLQYLSVASLMTGKISTYTVEVESNC